MASRLERLAVRLYLRAKGRRFLNQPKVPWELAACCRTRCKFRRMAREVLYESSNRL
jgi:hypothetical protein